MAPFNPVDHPLVVQAIERAAQAIAYNAQPDATVLSRHHRREVSKLEAALRKTIPVALSAAIDEIEFDVDRREARRRPRRTLERKHDPRELTLDVLGALGNIGVGVGDRYVVQRAEDA